MAPTVPPPVFHDPHGRRWSVMRAVLYALAAITTLVLSGFAVSVLTNPFLPRFRLHATRGLPREIESRPPPFPRRNAVTPRLSPDAQHALVALQHVRTQSPTPLGVRPQLMHVTPPPPRVPPTAIPAGRALAMGFYVNWDEASFASLRRNLARLDWVIPEWTRLQAGTDPVAVALDPRALDLIRRLRPQARIVPLLQNYHDGTWDGALMAARIADAASRAQLVAAITGIVERNRFSGVVVDFEEVPDEANANLLEFLRALHASFAPRGWSVGEAVPMNDDSWDYAGHQAATDYLFLMAYDQHYATSTPGPVAGQDWYEHALAARLAVLDPAKVIVCVGGYGYDWHVGQPQAEVVSFHEAVLAARDAHATVTFDPVSHNPTVRYADEDGAQHEAWFLDAVTAYNQVHIADRSHVAGYALWRLGAEDPSMWDGFTTASRIAPPASIRSITFPYDVEFTGTGEVLQVDAMPQEGVREIDVDAASGLIVGDVYRTLPTPYSIRRSGDRPGLAALTFDDGPDPLWTPRILDVLRDEHVHASFFIIGSNGAANPQLVRRIVTEGHDIGNHTYTHPNLGEASGRVIDLELNATQRLIASLTGRSTTLFRPPYFGDAEPQSPNEVLPIVRAEHLGYLTIGLRVDTDDWARPGSTEIVRRAIAGLTSTDDETRGQVVLLHDGGGDRSQTAAAMPALIHAIRARGLRLVTVSELIGLRREQAMPIVSSRERMLRFTDSMTFYALSVAEWLVHWIFTVGIALGLLRMVLVMILAAIEKLRTARERGAEPSVHPRVSVLVPAYNEEKVIARTIESLLESTYPDYEIVVIDDGSKDRTSDVVRERFADEKRVRLFRKPNGGKAEALNFGMTQATGEIVVALDADTVFPPEVLGELVRPFADAAVGAVAGNAKVGNRINLVTRWQALEYIASQNLDRRAFALLNCITVVPGAVGAWRRSEIEALGGFHSDTLAEDQDLTIKVLRRGCKIRYAERAIAWTEAPDTLGALAKQRYRWSFGTLQCMWKHRDALLRPRYGTLGLVAMPNVWLFQILFPLLAPLIDLLFVASIAWAVMERIEHPAAGAFVQLEPVLFYYVLFLAVDCLSAASAFLLERGEQWSLLGWFVLQRVCYRQVLYYVLFKSIVAAARGAFVGWGKLERKATVAAVR